MITPKKSKKVSRKSIVAASASSSASALTTTIAPTIKIVKKPSPAVGKKPKKTIAVSGIKKPHRYRPGTRALMEMRKLQKSTDLQIKRAPFKRLIDEIMSEIGDFRVSKQAKEALQQDTENGLDRLFRAANTIALRGGRKPQKTLFVRHMKAANDAAYLYPFTPVDSSFSQKKVAPPPRSKPKERDVITNNNNSNVEELEDDNNSYSYSSSQHNAIVPITNNGHSISSGKKPKRDSTIVSLPPTLPPPKHLSSKHNNSMDIMNQSLDSQHYGSM